MMVLDDSTSVYPFGWLYILKKKKKKSSRAYDGGTQSSQLAQHCRSPFYIIDIQRYPQFLPPLPEKFNRVENNWPEMSVVFVVSLFHIWVLTAGCDILHTPSNYLHAEGNYPSKVLCSVVINLFHHKK